MAIYIDKPDILNIHEAVLDLNPGNLADPSGFLKHVGFVYDTAKNLCERINSNYPGIQLDSGLACIGAGFHDIGRPLNKNQIFHELRGADYLEENGLSLGITDSHVSIKSIAQIARSHGFAYEYWINPENDKLKQEFGSIDASMLLPNSWEEQLATFSDMSSYDGKIISPEERMESLIKKYQGDPRYQSDMVVKTAKSAMTRILSLGRRVQALLEGRLTEEEISQYPFL